MTATALATPRFVRRTQLGPHEYRKNFRQIDGDIIAAVTSPEADRVTTLMSKVYLRLADAPSRYWERDGVLRFEAELRDDGHITAWAALCEVVGVASATARKALRWMHGQGVIGYFAGKNGVGIRIFLNRAMSSIGTRAAGQKILEFRRASSQAARTSQDEAAFNDSFADPEISDTDSDPRAPKNGAERTKEVKQHPSPHTPPIPVMPRETGMSVGRPPETVRLAEGDFGEIVSRISRDLGPSLEMAARRAAAREHERTREWLESRGLPKAARVAQREAYNVLRRYGVVRDVAQSSPTDVGCRHPAQEPRPLADGEVEELAEACLSMLEVKGQAVELTLTGLNAEAGGFLLPGDAARVRARVEGLLRDSRR